MTPIQPAGVARTSSTSARRPKVPRSTARNTRTGKNVSKIHGVVSRQSQVISRTATRLTTGDCRRETTGERSERGFTLIELLVVASVLVVLAGIGLVQYRNGKTRAS